MGFKNVVRAHLRACDVRCQLRRLGQPSLSEPTSATVRPRLGSFLFITFETLHCTVRSASVSAARVGLIKKKKKKKKKKKLILSVKSVK